jgi:tetratricopeptide (TPR) repeat protein
MPTVVNGIGTWYYGKRNIHRLKGTCEFCNRVGELTSYDTTLYFVFVMIPLVPLGHKRILNQCPSCQKHKVTSLRQWEAGKAAATAELLSRLEKNPDDRDTIMDGLGLAMGYQDQELFDKLAEALAAHRRDDSVIQAQLAAGYSYFARFPEAEAAYRAALAVEDTPVLQRQLGHVLLKMGRPEDAAPYLLPILETRDRADAGLIFLLIEALQAQGSHQQALELMDLRDEAFPDLALLAEYKQQRKRSQRYQHSGKKIASAYLSESPRAGYSKGNWTASVAKVAGPLLLLGLLALYLGSAVWIGFHRQVHLVNATPAAYPVTVNGRPQTLPPGVTAVRVPEGDLTVAFTDPGVQLPPVQCRVASNFFGRPFFGHTFVVNPDRLAILVEQEATYAEVPVPSPPDKLQTGEALYHFTGVDYEFTELPRTHRIDKGKTVTKTRVGLQQPPTPEARWRQVSLVLGPDQMPTYARQWLQFEPENTYFLSQLLQALPAEEGLAFLEPKLAVRPILVENHRFYQDLMDRHHPERDLRPDYEKLVGETKREPAALYLLARLGDNAEADRLLEEAAQAKPPSVPALHRLGFQALARGQFADAVRRLEQANRLAPTNVFVRDHYRSALLAAGQYDELLKEIATRPAEPIDRLFALLRVHAARSDLAKARATIASGAQLYPSAPAEIRQMVQSSLEMTLCCGTGDVAGFLKLSPEVPGLPGFEVALLRGQLHDAAGLVDRQNQHLALSHHGLLYLAARQANEKKLADEQWSLLLATLAKGGRQQRQLGDMLAGRKPVTVAAVRRLVLDPQEKRVLAAVAARRQPELEKELLALARQLNFQKDRISLCLGKVLAAGERRASARGTSRATDTCKRARFDKTCCPMPGMVSGNCPTGAATAGGV